MEVDPYVQLDDGWTSSEIKVCPYCLDLDLEHYGVPGIVEPKRSELFAFIDVVTAAEAGCRGCRLIHFAVKPYIDDGQASEAFLKLHFQKLPRSLLCFVELQGINVDCVELYKSRVGALDERSWPHLLPFRDSVSGFTGSRAALKKARSWLSTCITEHTCASVTPSFLPTRVLCIDGPDTVRLLVTTNEIALYACLSHCWGPQPRLVLRTTKATLESFRTRIPWDCLPNTFRDAIDFTYHLGLRYLWIDSLCIVQDSIEDWRREGSSMARIYNSAFVTLAASKAANPEDGCYSTPWQVHLSRTMTFATTNNDTPGEGHEVHTRTPLPHSDHDFPLFKRGWFHQERILSPRMIHFTKHELMWECGSSSLCECSHTAMPFHHFPKRRLHFLRRQHDPHFEWQDLVVDYTSKALSHPQDVFPALQGLAKQVPGVLGNYLGGLWALTLQSDLPWYAPYSQPRRPRPQLWRAPTWSWASTQARIEYDARGHGDIRTFATIINAVTVPVGEDPTGELTDGWLILKTMGVVGTLQLHQIDADPAHATHGITVPHLSESQHQSQLHGQHRGDSGMTWIHHLYLDYAIEEPGQYHVPDGSEVLLLKLNETYLENERQWEQTFLVLRKTNTARKSYERIGVVKMPVAHSQARVVEDWYEHAGKEMEVTIV